MNPNDRNPMLTAVLFLIGTVSMTVCAWHFFGWAGGIGMAGFFSLMTAMAVSR